MSRVLLVDDEPQLVRALRINLVARQYEVVVASGGAEALQRAADARPDLIVLDLGLPDIDGVDVIRELRSWTPVPILVLSGRVGSRDKVEALDAGADDYVTKPFSVDELLARVRAVTRRLGPAGELEPVRIGGHEVDFAARTVSGGVHLTRTEWRLLEVLARNPGKLVGQKQLLQEVWGPTYLKQTHYLRQYVTQLRHKLEEDPARPRHLLTEPGMGYRLRP
ncbi:response regulator [Dactylosporangium sp. NPDC000555]|uniref:response regulator n=1 Tax=Dactylosporangium sp. NPDC000555 TaxID=3154260 RepID=UPI003332C682